MFINFLNKFFSTCFNNSARVKSISQNKEKTKGDFFTFVFIFLFASHLFPLGKIIEGYLKNSGLGTTELLIFLKRVAVYDLIPLLLLFLLFHFYLNKKAKLKENLHLIFVVWTPALLIRTFFEGIPNIFPQLSFYPLPFVTVPQLLAYAEGIITAFACYNIFKRNKVVEIDINRKKSILILWFAFVLTGFTIMFWQPFYDSTPFFIKAPNFTLAANNGKSCSLSDYKGKTIFLEFWKFNCPQCKKQAKEIKKLADKINPEKVAIITVHTSGAGPDSKVAKKMIEHKNITLCFDNRRVSRKYSKLPPYHKLQSVPHMMIIDKNGYIRKIMRGYKPYRLLKSTLDDYL
ncbi:MAG: TlpA disulfide reductase family protein [Deltaproteobacteria bacterium]|nr:TlpA disulfide reductase family protein [Deltaproteobacteria bacterium]